MYNKLGIEPLLSIVYIAVKIPERTEKNFPTEHQATNKVIYDSVTLECFMLVKLWKEQRQKGWRDSCGCNRILVSFCCCACLPSNHSRNLKDTLPAPPVLCVTWIHFRNAVWWMIFPKIYLVLSQESLCFSLFPVYVELNGQFGRVLKKNELTLWTVFNSQCSTHLCCRDVYWS